MIEIRSSSFNCASWEWNGDGWDADGDPSEALSAARSGDFSHYAPSEACLLRAFDDNGECVGELEFVPLAAK